MADPFAYPTQHREKYLGLPARNALAVTPSDSVEIDIPQALYVGTGGTLIVKFVDGASNVTFTNVPSGTTLPFRVRLVVATGTTASGIVAIY